MRILIVDDEEAVRIALADLLGDAGHDVRSAEHVPSALAMMEGFVPDLVLSDLRMPVLSGLQLLEILRRDHPRVLLVLLTAHGDERTAVQALRAGAWDYVPKPFDNAEILATVERARELLALRTENARLREELGGAGHGIVGRSAAIAEVRRLVARVAPSEATVLVTGESGTGKELVARALHEASARKHAPFVALNCAALPSELIESELFGHRKGAFTGATQDREGLFEAAHRGTLFLDEIGDLALSAQAKLLRVLETREVVRLGATKGVPVDVRIVAATHRSPRELAAEGRFREDLLYRLAVVEIEVPPLRERREDIPMLAAHFARTATSYGITERPLSEAAVRALAAYEWPGNVRELRNVVHRALLLADGDAVVPTDLTPQVLAADSPLSPDDAALAELSFQEARRRALAAFDHSYLTAVFRKCGFNVTRTAEVLGMHRQTLQKLLTRYGIERPGGE